MRKNKVAQIGRMVNRKRIVRTIGFDSDVILSLISDGENFSLFRPKIFNRSNSLYVNYKVFSELMGILMYRHNYSQQDAVNKLFSFMRQNHIKLIKKTETDLSKVKVILDELKKKRQLLSNPAGDSDLEIIAIYKAHEIDCIITRNQTHFRPFCEYVNIEVEGLMKDVDVLFRRAFGWKRKGKKR